MKFPDVKLCRIHIFFRTERMARNICHEVGKGPLVGLCVLKGGYQFFGDLMDCIRTISASGGKEIKD